MVLEFSQNKFIPFEKTSDFLKEIALIPETISNCEFRNQILTILNSFSINQKQKATYPQIFDMAFYQYLPETQKKLIESSAVHFADTNWNEGIHDIHFCFAVNPGTGQLAIWESYDDGSHMVLLDQKFWLMNQTWEFYAHPEALLPQNEHLHIHQDL